MTKDRKPFVRDKSILATIIMIAVTVIILLIAYFQINRIVENRCLERMQEGADTVTDEIVNRLIRDARLLNAAADVLAKLDDFDDIESVSTTMRVISPILETRRIRVLLPDNQIIDSDGTVMDGSAFVSFAAEAPLGEHVSNRTVDAVDGVTPTYRYFVPIVQDGETVALLYGVTALDTLPKSMNINNIYNGNASAYIIDTETGDYLMDTWHSELSNIHDADNHAVRDGNWADAVQALLSGESGYFVYRSEATNEWRYIYYAPADINHWTIAVSIPEAEALSSLYDFQRVSIVVGILMAIAIVFYYLWVLQNAKKTMKRRVERAVLEERLHKAEAAERAKTTFLTNMSHDIRTPMNAIIGFTTLAQTSINNPERIEEYLGKILSSSNHLLSLINDILDMSRIESGRMNIDEKECNLSDIFKDMRNILQTQMQLKQLNFFMDTIDVVDEDIYCDKLHVNQVLLNLLSNAIKFTPPGGTVSLTVKQLLGAPKGYGTYEIRVKDTGIGMSEEFAQHIFEPFERERSSTISGIQGTGLGMTIAKSIVDTMGGTIQLNTEKGKGTEFIVTFDFRLQTGPKQAAPIAELEGLRALVVDDTFSACDSVTKMLSQIGMRPEWTMHGREAVLRAKQAIELGDAFGVYVVDWVLPDLNGLEITRQLRAVIGEEIPIIILTAYDWSEFEDEAYNAGVTAFCGKPIFMSELRSVLASVMATVSSSSDTVEEEDSGDENAALPDTETPDIHNGRRILIVEDIDLNLEIAQAILGEAGFITESAANGEIAVNMVKESQPGYYDLILMDIQMPVMDGYQATRAIRALDDPALAQIPIVAMTANAFDADRKLAFESGMNEHVTKPIDVDQLFGVLDRILDQKTS